MKLYLTLAWRYLWGRRLRSGLTLLAIVLAVMITVAMQGILPAVKSSFDENLTAAVHEVDLVLRHASGETFAQELAARVDETPGVDAVVAVLERTLRLPPEAAIATEDARPISAVVVNGVDPATAAAVIPIRPLVGRWVAPGDERALLIRASLAERVGLGVGDTVRLPGANGVVAFTVVGVLPTRPLAGDEEVTMALADAQALFNAPGRINAVVARFAAGQDDEALRGQIVADLGAGYTAGSVGAGSEAWQAALRLGDAAFTLFGVLALAMAGFIVLNTFRTGVAERRRDIAMLRAIGAERRTVMGLVVAESLLLGVAGTVLGALLGVLLVNGLLAALGPVWAGFFGAPLGAPAFGVRSLLFSVALGVGVPLLAGLLPARAAARVTPLEALRPHGTSSGRTQRRRELLISAVLLLLALLALLSDEARLATGGALLTLVALTVASPALVGPAAATFGRALVRLMPREGTLAQRNMLRNPERAAVTASSITISMAILVALAGLTATFTGGLMSYLERSMRADYLVLPEALVLGQGNVEAGPQLAERLRAAPGIADVTTIRRATAQHGGTGVQVLGIDPASYPRVAGLVFSAGDPAGAYAALAGGDAIIVNGVFAAQHRVVPGSPVTLETPAGPRTYTVAAIGLDYLNARQASVYLSQAELEAAFGQRNDALLMANRARDADARATEAYLRDLLRDHPAFSLLVYEQWRAEQLAANQTRSNILYVLMALLALPSLIALANTLGVNVLERTREIGVLRAIGGTRGQVQRTILAESLLLAVLGVAGGITAGAVLGYALVSAINQGGLLFAYTFPVEGALLALVIGLGFGALAALLPARRAAHMDIVAALRHT
jgi:putative ABC transport system permease protein